MRPRTSYPLRGPASTLNDVIKYGYFHQIRLLISTGMDIEICDASRRTPIIYCAFMEPEEWGMSTAMTLIEAGARLAHRDRFSRNVLHYACIYGRESLVQVLLRAIDFDLNQSDKMGNTALHYAAISGNVAITHLVAQAFKRYKIGLGKVNNIGRTALEEASRAGYVTCAQIIAGRRPGSAVKELRFADVTMSGSYNQRSHEFSAQSKRRLLRPMSAVFVNRPDSSSSMASLEERKSPFSCNRSPSNLSLQINGYNRKSNNPLYANGYKKDEEIIHCATEKDFRNNPGYVFKLVHLPYDPEDWDPLAMMDSSNRNTTNSWPEESSTSQTQQVIARVDWRQDLKLLFKVYENQCSSSWRAVKKTYYTPSVEHDPSCPGPEDLEDKGRRARRQSVASRSSGHGKEGVPDLKRRPSTTRLRRLPSSYGSVGRVSMDGSLDTSSESINSLASTKRRGGDREAVLGGRPDGTSKSPSPPPQQISTLTKGCSNDVSPNVVNSSSTATSVISNSTRIEVPPIPAEGKQPNSHSKVNGKDIVGRLHGSGKGNGFIKGKVPLSLIQRRDSNQNSQNKSSPPDGSSKHGSATTPVSNQKNIPKVKEILVPDLISDNGCHQRVDTSLLTVHNPYDDEDYDSDENEDNLTDDVGEE